MRKQWKTVPETEYWQPSHEAWSRAFSSFSRAADNILRYILRTVLSILGHQVGEVSYTMTRHYPGHELLLFWELAPEKWERMAPELRMNCPWNHQDDACQPTEGLSEERSELPACFPQAPSPVCLWERSPLVRGGLGLCTDIHPTPSAGPWNKAYYPPTWPVCWVEWQAAGPTTHPPVTGGPACRAGPVSAFRAGTLLPACAAKGLRLGCDYTGRRRVRLPCCLLPKSLFLDTCTGSRKLARTNAGKHGSWWASESSVKSPFP